jgi:Protein of unknown function (DUF3795)
MDEMIAYCGLSCRTCPIYLASRELNEKKKNDLIAKIIQECKEHYGIEYSFHDINECDGCRIFNGRIFSGCEKCIVRICANQNQVENCAYCNEYPCGNLKELFKVSPETKKYLDTIHRNIDFSQNHN